MRGPSTADLSGRRAALLRPACPVPGRAPCAPAWGERSGECRRRRAPRGAGVAPVAATPIAWLIASTTAAPASAPVSRRVPSGLPGGCSRPAVARAAQPATASAAAGRNSPRGRRNGSAAQGEGYQQHRGRETTVPEGGPTHHRDERANRACRNDGSQPPVLLIDRARVGVGDDREHQRCAETPARGGQRAQRRTDSEPRAGGGGTHERTLSGHGAPAQKRMRSHEGRPVHRSGARRGS